MTILDQPQNIAQAGSPILFYVEEANTPTQFYCDIYIWTGATTSKPAQPEYTLKKKPDGIRAIFNVAPFVYDKLSNRNPDEFIGADFKTAANEVIWVECTFRADAAIPPAPLDSNTILCTQGVSRHTNGINEQPPQVAMAHGEMLLFPQSRMVWGIYNNAAYPTMNRVLVTFDLGGTATYTNTATNQLSSINNLLWVDVSPSQYTQGVEYENWYKVELLQADDTVLKTVRYDIDCEPKYFPLTIGYLNRYGAYEYVPFQKKSESSISVEHEQFMKSTLSTAGNVLSSDPSRPQYQRFNINTRGMITLNTNFLHEGIFMNMEDILAAPEAVLVEFGWAVNADTQSFVIQQHVNMKLVRYTLEFSYAFENQSIVQ